MLTRPISSFIYTNVNVPIGVELTNSAASTTSIGAKVAKKSLSMMAATVNSGGGSSKAQMLRDFSLEIMISKSFSVFCAIGLTTH